MPDDDEGRAPGRAPATGPAGEAERAGQSGHDRPAVTVQEEGSPSVGTRLSADEIHDNVRKAAQEELDRPLGALLWSSIAAGITITASFLAAGYAASLVEDEALRRAAAAAAYPLGFVLVVIGRQQLFTENTLEPVIPLLDRFSWRRLGRVLRLWVAVLGGNVVGSLLMAWVLARTSLLDPEIVASMEHVAHEATTGTFGQVLWRAIFAGWLVGMMAWLVGATRATGAQMAIVWLTTAPIVALGFKHSIAGTVEAFYLALRGGATWGTMLGDFLAAAVLGNVIGGVLLVALLNHGQVAHGRDEGEGSEDGRRA